MSSSDFEKELIIEDILEQAKEIKKSRKYSSDEVNKILEERAKPRKISDKEKEEVPSREVPSREAPSREVPSREVPSREVSYKEVPSKEVPSKEVPSKEVPSGEAPSEEGGKEVAFKAEADETPVLKGDSLKLEVEDVHDITKSKEKQRDKSSKAIKEDKTKDSEEQENISEDETLEDKLAVEDIKIYKPPKAESSVSNKTIEFILKKESSLDESKKYKLNRDKNIVFHHGEKEDLEQIHLESLLIDGDSDDELEELDFVAEKKGEKESKWEENFKKAREKKASKFRAGFKITGDEEENDPAEEFEPFEDGELDDYKSYDETENVRSGLNYRRRMAWFRFILTLGIALALFLVNLISFSGIHMNPYFLNGINAFLLFVAAILNHQTIGIGFRELFRFSPSSETAITVPVIVTFIHTLSKFIPENINNEKYLVWSSIGAFALLCSSLGELLVIRRISSNFRLVSHPQEKYVVKTVDDDDMAIEMGEDTVDHGVPVVAYTRKTEFLTRFLANSYERDIADRPSGIFCFISMLVSLAVAIIYGYVHKSVWDGLSAFTLSLCCSLPIGTMISSNLPMFRISRKILRYGSMLVGWQAVRDFGDVHALAVDATDLFPSENVLLHGIKTFSGTRIDKAILDAAAVAVEAGGPLSSVFLRIIEENKEILPSVDTVVYEQDMGMSGWVDGRRVLIGNRILLENHGVATPSSDFESRYAIEDRKIIYLSVAGELSSMFVLSYVPDESIAAALESLERADVTLLVKTTDPNITEELVCETYDLDDYYVEIMNAGAGRSFDKLTRETKSRDESVVGSNGRVDGVAYAVAGCRRLEKAVHLALVIQILGATLGLALSILFVLFTSVFLAPLYVLGYLIIWLALSWILPMAYRL